MSTPFTLRPASTGTEQRRAFQFIEQHVVGFSSSRAMKTDTKVRPAVTALLPVGVGGTLATAIMFTAHDADGTMVGAISAHPPYAEGAEIRGNGDVALARGFLHDRRTVNGLAVADDWRRQGVATELLENVEQVARIEGAEWLTGFMDERNGPPDFYSARGFTITQRNRAIPPLPPSRLTERHPNYVDGQWFYRRIV